MKLSKLAIFHLFSRDFFFFFLPLYSNDMTPKQKFQIFSPLFVCLLSWTHIWHIFLQSPCIRTIWHRFQETWKNTCFPSFFKFSLFVKLDTCLAYLSQVSLYSNDMTPNARNLKKKHLFSCLYLRKFWICHSGFSKRSFWCKQHSCSCLFSQLSTKLLKLTKLSWSFF